MRIAFLLPHFRPGGAERVVLNLLRALDRKRFAPNLFLSRADGSFLDLLPRDVPVVELGGRRARSLPLAIAAQLRSRRIDLAYSATNAMNLALLAAPASNVVRIASEHTPPAAYLAEVKRPRLRKALMACLYPRADRIAVPTEAIGRELAALLRGRLLSLETLPNPVIDRVTAKRTEKPVRERPSIAAAGRLVEAKGFDLLVKAAAILRREGIDADWTIFGEGPQRDSLVRQARALGLGDRVSFSGHAADLPAAIAAADLFVLSSRREGFGNVVIEAMTAGVPVLAARSSGPEAIIDHARNGFLCPPDDAATLAFAIAELLRDPTRRDAVIEPAFETAKRYEVGPATAHFERLAESLFETRIRD
jgi:glycosyltransferase involved in cell wall biosynthesis